MLYDVILAHMNEPDSMDVSRCVSTITTNKDNNTFTKQTILYQSNIFVYEIATVEESYMYIMKSISYNVLCIYIYIYTYTCIINSRCNKDNIYIYIYIYT